MSFGGRLSVVLGLFVVAVGLVVFTAASLLGAQPATVDFTAGHSAGSPVDITVQTFGAIGSGPHPTWVSYEVKDQSGKWVHSTSWQVPANTRINMTVEQFDSGSPLRNQQWGLVQGVIGHTATLNGSTFSAYDSNSGNGVGHTFAIPTLDLNVPLVGVDSNAKNICSQAPCDSSSVSNTITFSFMSPSPGQYPWQCYVPCGLGYLFGNGGPMSTQNYMGGFLKVVA